MRIAIVHYHLLDGGVSEIIRATSRMLSDRQIPHVILAGAHIRSDGLPLEIIPELGYEPADGHGCSVHDLVARLHRAASRRLGAPPDVWHIHNHSLGKNLLLTRAVAHLARSGERLLLHLHDLAEDGRPAMLARIHGRQQPWPGLPAPEPTTLPSDNIHDLYPSGPHIHYAFLNERDREWFLNAGLPPASSSLLGGPLQSLLIEGSALPDRPPLLFAPIRGIRRKNLGELVLLGMLAPPPVGIAISRAPRDPAAIAIHDRWQAFAAEHAPRVRFAVTDREAPAPGAPATFESWVYHATHIVGTSIAEGLGLPFLEAFEWRKPFIGRRLNHLRYLAPSSSTYDRLLIPADWITRSVLLEHIECTLDRERRMHGIAHSAGTSERILGSLDLNGFHDFGNLPEPIQQGVIERSSDPAERAGILIESDSVRIPAVEWLANQLRETIPHAGPPPNPPPADPVPIYQNLHDRPATANPITTWLDPSTIRSVAMHHGRFHFLTSAAPVHPLRRGRFDVVIFDIYGTLLDTPAGPIRPDPSVDGKIAAVLRQLGYEPPDAPTAALHAAVLRHHAASDRDFPEVDLRTLWSELLGIPADDLTRLVTATEDARSPATPVPGAFNAVSAIAAAGIRVGLLSNAQCNALPSLDTIAPLFDPELTILSYLHGSAKPSPSIYQAMAETLAAQGIPPARTLMVGNDPSHDIAPAAAMGWHTAWFSRTGGTLPEANHCFSSWRVLTRLASGIH